MLKDLDFDFLHDFLNKKGSSFRIEMLRNRLTLRARILFRADKSKNQEKRSFEYAA